MKSKHLAGSRTTDDADVEKTQVVQTVIASRSERIWSRRIAGVLRDAIVRSDPDRAGEVRGKSRHKILFSRVGDFVGVIVEYRHILLILQE